MTVADDLIAIRTLLILRGRAVDVAEDDAGQICLGQALIEVCRPSLERMGAVLHALRHQMSPHQAVIGDSGDIVVFNDCIAKDDQDVYDLIGKALADLGAFV